MKNNGAGDLGLPDSRELPDPYGLPDPHGLPDLRGAIVGQIRILDLLGEGGVGQVWVGYDEWLERKVALKAIRHDDHELKTRLLQEARILSQLDHPKICKVYGILDSEETTFLALEFVEGRNLRSFLREAPGFENKLDVACQVVEALLVAHGQGVVHRDLKPENVMITPDGEVKVLDFGLARHLNDELTTLDSADSSFSEHRALYLRGTAAYMSPEQAQGERVTEASDQFAFGVLLQELFTDRLPYDPDLSRPQLLLKVAQGATHPMASGDGELDALVEDLKSLAPGERPGASQVLAALRRIRDRPRRRRQAWQAATTAVVLTVALGLVILVWQRGLEEKETVTPSLSAGRTGLAASELSRLAEELSESLEARRDLDQEIRRIASELKDEPLAQAAWLDAVGRIYHELGLGREAELALRRALELREQTLGEVHPSLAYSLNTLAGVLRERGAVAEASELEQRAAEVRAGK